MRQIEYISPSGLQTWKQDAERYYLRYLATTKLPSEPQTQAMSIGSSFDAYAKSYLYERLFGKDDPKYSFVNIFEAQVEPQWRDWALLHGQYVFDIYKKSGCLGDLLLELQQAVNVPKFEIEIKGVIGGRREGASLAHLNVVLLGKPDVFYINAHGAHVILDFKVNGYVSRQGISPKQGYVRLRNDNKKTGCHRDCAMYMHHGMLINIGLPLEKLDTQWAAQLGTYAWLCGCEIGEDFIVGIDQICCDTTKAVGGFPAIRIAEHRTKISRDFQIKTFNEYQTLWELAHSDHFFRELSIHDSHARCQLLDEQVKNMAAETDAVFLEMTREKPSFYRPQ